MRNATKYFWPCDRERVERLPIYEKGRLFQKTLFHHSIADEPSYDRADTKPLNHTVLPHKGLAYRLDDARSNVASIRKLDTFYA